MPVSIALKPPQSNSYTSLIKAIVTGKILLITVHNILTMISRTCSDWASLSSILVVVLINPEAVSMLNKD
jgi:hypothetical protein